MCAEYLVWITAVVNLLRLQALDELMASRNCRIFLVFIQVENTFWLGLLRTPIILCWKQCCPLRPENVTVTKSAANSCLHDLRRHTGVVDICTLVLNLLLLPLWWKCPNPNLQWKSAFIGQCCPKQFFIFFNILGACFEICKHINTHFKQHYRFQSV